MLNIIEIKDFNAPELDVYARFTEAQLLNKDRPEEWEPFSGQRQPFIWKQCC